jgi:hypothetical protein
MRVAHYARVQLVENTLRLVQKKPSQTSATDERQRAGNIRVVLKRRFG